MIFILRLMRCLKSDVSYLAVRYRELLADSEVGTQIRYKISSGYNNFNPRYITRHSQYLPDKYSGPPRPVYQVYRDAPADLSTPVQAGPLSLVQSFPSDACASNLMP